MNNILVTSKSNAKKNNYKLEIFNSISNNAKNDIIGYSTIKKFFNNIYDNGGNAFSTFSVDQRLDEGMYAAETSNKIRTSYAVSSNVFV